MMVAHSSEMMHVECEDSAINILHERIAHLGQLRASTLAVIDEHSLLPCIHLLCDCLPTMLNLC